MSPSTGSWVYTSKEEPSTRWCCEVKSWWFLNSSPPIYIYKLRWIFGLFMFQLSYGFLDTPWFVIHLPLSDSRFSGHRPTEGCCALCDWLLNTQFFEAFKGGWPMSCCRPLGQFLVLISIETETAEKKRVWSGLLWDEFLFPLIWFTWFTAYDFLLFKPCSIFRLSWHVSEGRRRIG